MLHTLTPTTPSSRRRALLLAAASLPLASACGALTRSRPRPGRDAAHAAFAQLEASLGGRLGVFAIDTADGATLGHRADERFAMASSFKAILAAAMLARSVQERGLMQRLVRYGAGDLLPHSPVTGRHVAEGMTVAALCAATVQYSDNAAANLLLDVLGGPAALTAFARTIGDTQFRLDRTEPALNSALPGDPRDTTTPQAMARTLRTLVLGDALPPPQRAQLTDWLVGNTTGGARIRAGVPADWRVGDKTGTGNHGAASDIGVVWPPGRAPLVVVVYTWREAADAKPREDVIAQATRAVVGWATSGR